MRVLKKKIKKFSENFEKPIDKSKTIWYNDITITKQSD